MGWLGSLGGSPLHMVSIGSLPWEAAGGRIAPCRGSWGRLCAGSSSRVLFWDASVPFYVASRLYVGLPQNMAAGLHEHKPQLMSVCEGLLRHACQRPVGQGASHSPPECLQERGLHEAMNTEKRRIGANNEQYTTL